MAQTFKIKGKRQIYNLTAYFVLPFSLCDNNALCRSSQVEACHDKVVSSVGVSSGDALQTVGVFLDSQEGVLSFYSVQPGGALLPLHCFKSSFTQPLYPALSVSKTQLSLCDLFSDTN